MKHAYQIDFLRLVAMLLVFATHSVILLNSGEGATNFYHRYCVYGGYAVEFFILLSAFLCAYKYDDSCNKGLGTVREFVKKKAIRLFPVHWTCMLAYLPMAILMDGQMRTLRAIVPTALLLQSAHRLTVTTINGPSWTISVLFILYFVTPMAMSWIRRIKTMRTCLMLIAALLVVEHFQNEWLRSLRPEDTWFFYSSPHSRITNYSIGLLSGYTMRQFPLKDYISRYPNLLETLAAVTVWYTATFCANDFLPIYSSITFAVAVFFVGKGFLSRFMSLELFRYASSLSFSFYMAHFLFIASTIYVTDHKFGGTLSVVQCSIMISTAFVLTIISAIVLHEFIEKRLANHIKQKMSHEP